MEPILYNETVTNFARNIPNIVKIINSTTEILNGSHIMENYIERNGSVADIFYDRDKLIETLNDGGFDNKNAIGLANSTLRMGVIIGKSAIQNKSKTNFRFRLLKSLLVKKFHSCNFIKTVSKFFSKF